MTMHENTEEFLIFNECREAVSSIIYMTMYENIEEFLIFNAFCNGRLREIFSFGYVTAVF